MKDEKIKFGIEKLSRYRNITTELTSVLAFNEVVELSDHVNKLLIEFERQRHLEFLDLLCWKQLNKNDNLLMQLGICDSALESLPFKKTEVDQFLLKKWSYLKLRLIAEQAFEYLSDEDWNSLAAFLVEHIDPSLLEYAAKLDFNDISWPRSSRKQEEIWFTALHKGVEANKKVAFDAFYAVECFKGRDAERIQRYPLLSDLLNEVLKNITEKYEHTTKLHELEKACNQFF